MAEPVRLDSPAFTFLDSADFAAGEPAVAVPASSPSVITVASAPPTAVVLAYRMLKLLFAESAWPRGLVGHVVSLA
ncbi:hypothetical protein ADL21_25795 [Streptomyces albus subsp. albus]|nr:hypothetical protein ADL21_25795 [Streptomyces albus subsp. albus]